MEIIYAYQKRFSDDFSFYIKIMMFLEIYVCRKFLIVFMYIKFFFIDIFIPSLHWYIMATICDTFSDEFEPDFGRYSAFLFFGAFEGPSPHTPKIFVAVCGGHCLVTRGMLQNNTFQNRGVLQNNTLQKRGVIPQFR